MEKKFETRLTAQGPKGAWTILPIPFDVKEAFGTKARVPVKGTINGFPFRNSVMPEGNGTHRMMVGKELLAGAKAAAGDLVKVTMAMDRAERVMEVPPELQAALRGDKEASANFEAMAYSHKKEYVEWIAGAKKAETKTARIAKALEMIRAKKRQR
jgi:hypothetical protein